jgi:hypothetical protein
MLHIRAFILRFDMDGKGRQGGFFYFIHFSIALCSIFCEHGADESRLAAWLAVLVGWDGMAG